ncbi:MAG TPA: cyclic nucleotide-binding domain-containing protein [Actinomycetota bacterium]|nr:cyclic nucleotide-binding domain-containing protein [Actinomycetota bacterium]
MRRQVAQALAGVPLFSGLSKRQLRRLADAGREVSMKEGWRIVGEGEPGDDLFVILEGEARVVARSGRTLARLLPGDFFGEISLLDGGVRTATVVAETPISLLRIDRAGLARIVKEDPGVGLRMLEELARRLRRMERPLAG